MNMCRERRLAENGEWRMAEEDDEAINDLKVSALMTGVYLAGMQALHPLHQSFVRCRQPKVAVSIMACCQSGRA